MRKRLALLSLALVPLAAACAVHRQVRSNALEYLYPTGTQAAPARDVELQLPARVGLAFAPASGMVGGPSEEQKQQLLERIREQFEGRDFIASVQVIPSAYLKQGGGFEDVERVGAAFGIDVLALVSYDQVQFSGSGKSSIAYWTIIGAYLVKGEKSETSTMLDAAVFDIASRAMLFNAPGRSAVRGSSTPVEVEKDLRSRSLEGFEEATTNLVANLETALDAFQVQARSGTVRGAGTPAVKFLDAAGNPIAADANPGSGGASGGAGLIAAALLGVAGLLEWRARRG